MINTISRVLLMSSLVALTACGGGGADDTTPVASLEILAELTQQNTTKEPIDATGTWITACYTSSDTGYDQKDIHTIIGKDISITADLYSSTDASCSSGATTDFIAVDLAVTTNGTKIMAGWLNAIPDRSDLTGSLTSQPTVTRLDIDASSINLGTVKEVFYIDDTATPWIMYRSRNAGTDGYPDDLNDVDPLIKQ